MATKRISDLTAVNLVSGSAVIPVVQDGTTVKVTFANLTGSIAGLTATPATASHALTALTASYAVSASHEITFELSSSYAETATSASYAQNASTADSSTSASFATSASLASTATTASIASDLYKASGTISAGIGADSNIIQISGSLIQLGNPTLYTETLVHRALGISGSLVVHNTLGNGFASIGVDNAGDAQIGANNYLNILLKNDGRSTLYNGVHISASISVQDGEVLTLKPTHPLPSYSIPTGSFAVSGSTPAKPYFWDGSSWNALY